MIGRRVLAGGLATALLGRRLHAEDATRPVRLLVGAPEGVGTDLEARAFAPFLERHLPHAEADFVNLPGEAGLVAYRAIGEAPTTPLTLGWVASPPLAARMVDRGAAGLLDRMTLVGAVQAEPLVLVVPAGSPLDSPQAVLESSASAAATPFGTPPAGSPPHLATLGLQEKIGKPLNTVAFPSVAAVRQAAIDGNVACAMLTLGDAVAALRDGRLDGIAIAAAERLDALPDLPTLTEAGIGFFARVLRGLAVPRTLPEPVVAELRMALRAVIADPEYKAQGDASGFSLVWIDGAAWRERILVEQAELLTLWQKTPWLAGRAG